MTQQQPTDTTDDLPGFLDEARTDDGTAPAAEPAAAADEPAATAPTPTPRERRAQVRRLEDRGTDYRAPGFVIGLLLLLAGTVCGVLQHTGRLPSEVFEFGLQPSVLFVVGGVAMGTTMVRRQVGRAMNRIDGVVTHQDEIAEVMRSDLQYLVDAQNNLAQLVPTDGNDTQRLLVALQRQDEKINNLTRAMKMYGKPLMEVANQGADTIAASNQVKTHVEGLLEASKQGFARLENGLRAGLGRKDLDEVRADVVRAAAQADKQLTTLGERLQRQEPVPQHLTRVEALVQALGQRLDDSAVQKGMLRLEDSLTKTGEQVTRLAGETVPGSAQRLEQRVDAAAQKLQSGLDALRNGNLGAVESGLRELQREMAGVATAVSQIQQAVRSGLRSAAAPAAAVAPAAPTATAPAAPAAPVAAPAAAVAAAAPAQPTGGAEAAAPAAAGTGTDAQTGVDQNKTGTRATSGKNVLGAIARLKQMKN